MFFFESDNQETDIEWLSDPESISNGGTRKLWLTNQDTDGNGKTYLAIDPPSDPTSTEHEYRIDWTEGLVRWFVDGQRSGRRPTTSPACPAPGCSTTGRMATRAGLLGLRRRTLCSRFGPLRCTTTLLEELHE